MPDTFNMLKDVHDTVVGTDDIRVGCVVAEDIVYLYVTAETYYLVAYGMLEAQDDGYRDDHDGQSDGYTNGSDTDSRTTHFPFVALVTVYAPGYE